MSRTKQNMPRSLRVGAAATPRTHAAPKRWLWPALGSLIVALGVIGGLIVAPLLRSAGPHGVPESKIDHDVSALLAGIPQTQSRLGAPSAPVTLQVYLDLKDPDSRNWFLKDLPPIIRAYVRPGTLKLEYRAYKTNTRNPVEFVRDQTAALAAGAQDKLWNYTYIFYAEQHNEFARYATERYLNQIAEQIPALNHTIWQTDRHTGRREEQTTAEDQTARTLHLHVTPSFRIGKTGHPLHNYTGHAIIKYGEQHPIALPETTDISQAIKKLTR
jgi:Thioredoxin